MNYKTGDRLVYPFYGAGEVTSIESVEVLGKMREYYILTFDHLKVKINVPVDNADSLGIRKLICPEEVRAVYERFLLPVDTSVTNWNKKQRESMEKLRSGNIFDAVDVFVYLKKREMRKNISTGEKKFMQSAYNSIVSELSYVENSDIDTVSKKILSIIEELKKEW